MQECEGWEGGLPAVSFQVQVCFPEFTPGFLMGGAKTLKSFSKYVPRKSKVL